MIHIVDDDAQVRASAGFLLRSLGYTTQGHADGESFLAQPNIEGCVLLDLRMPGLSGLEVQEALLARGATVPVIMMSGQGDRRSVAAAERLGAVRFLEKPYLVDELIDAVERASKLLEANEGALAAELA
jgi:two-component system, LuxR family, response regulator FixJ